MANPPAANTGTYRRCAFITTAFSRTWAKPASRRVDADATAPVQPPLRTFEVLDQVPMLRTRQPVSTQPAGRSLVPHSRCWSLLRSSQPAKLPGVADDRRSPGHQLAAGQAQKPVAAAATDTLAGRSACSAAVSTRQQVVRVSDGRAQVARSSTPGCRPIRGTNPSSTPIKRGRRREQRRQSTPAPQPSKASPPALARRYWPSARCASGHGAGGVRGRCHIFVKSSGSAARCAA